MYQQQFDIISNNLASNNWQWFKDNAINVKDAGPYYILNYDQIASYVIGMNEYNVLTRGTVFDKNGKLVSFPFKRFFNRGEPYADRINYGDPQTCILEKLDGSLLNVFFNENNEPVYNTRKMISANINDMDIKSKSFITGDDVNLMREFGSYVQNINYISAQKDFFNTKNVTLIFEIVTKTNKVVTNYSDDKLGLYLIGCRNMDTLEEFSEPELDQIVQILGVKRPCYYFVDGGYSEIKRFLDENFSNDFEGFVVRCGDKRVKIKKDTYLELHRTLSDISLKTLVPVVMSGEIEELRLYQQSTEAINIINDIEQRLNKLIEDIINSWSSVSQFNVIGVSRQNAKKQFVSMLKTNNIKYSDFMTKIYDGKMDLNNLNVSIRQALKNKSINNMLELLGYK